MLDKDQLEQFNNNGFLVLNNFVSHDTCDKMHQECEKIIESNNFAQEIKNISVFAANESETKNRDKYFLTSVDKIRPFLEEKANQILQNENKSTKIFNKIGHALHALDPVFNEVTFDNKVKDVFKSLGFVRPVVCQSMYIFKQPFIGGEVQAHQDGSYLYTDPLKVVGIWIALEDCTVENGCLQFIPGSHKGGHLANRFIRNPNKEEFEKGNYLIYTNDRTKVHWDEDKFVPVPVKAGDALLIDGLVVHKSSANLSPKSRHIYTFHVYESDKAEFSKENWMEYSPTTFLPLY